MSQRSRMVLAVLFGLSNGPHLAAHQPGPLRPVDGSTCPEPRWETPVPQPGSSKAITYDSTREVSILVHSQLDEGTRTWQWDGRSWESVFVGGPSARSGHAITYDPDRDRVVLFGGTFGGNQTWEWDGRVWERVSTEGPAPRSGAHLAYDEANQRTVLFGGSPGGEETWTWDGASWTLAATTGPEPSTAGDMTYDAGRRVVVYQGPETFAIDRQTWEWDGLVWTRVADGPRSDDVVLTYDSVRGVVVMFENSFPAGTWQWDGIEWTQVGDCVDDQCFVDQGAVATFDRRRGVAVMHGGTDGFDFFRGYGDTWEWDGAEWIVAGPMPRPRRESAIGFDGERILLTGGYYSGSYGPLADGSVWSWDGAIWSRTGSALSVRGAAVAYDSLRDTLVLHGGTNAGGDFDFRDTRIWNGTSWQDLAGSGPEGADLMVYDEARDVMVLFTDADATWEWDRDTWTRVATTGPTVAEGMAYDVAVGRTILIGFGATWEWDGVAWVRTLSAGTPSGALAYDRDRARTLLLDEGGRGWGWSGSGWELLSESGPTGCAASAAYDEHRQIVVALCEDGGLWEFDEPPLTLETSAIVRGSTARFEMEHARPGELVELFRGSNGEGEGPCSDAIGGRCLDLLPPVALLGAATAGSDCRAALEVEVPAAVPLAPLSTQAVVRRGDDGAASKLSPARTSAIVDPVGTDFHHRAARGEDWPWRYRIVNATAAPVTVDVTTAHERPDGSLEILSVDLSVEVPAFGALVEKLEIGLTIDEPEGTHRARATIDDPIGGVTLDEGSARFELRADGDGSPAATEGARERGRSGAAPNLTVNARVAAGGTWSYGYELVADPGSPSDVRVEVVLTDPVGDASSVEGPTDVTLVEGAPLDVDGSAAFPIGAPGGLYSAVVRVTDLDGRTVSESSAVSFVLNGCGDAVLDPGEQCDDGNVAAGDGCSSICTEEVCGNGILDPGEECDDGANLPGDGCRADCLLECGDGVLDPAEECDDGNLIPGDGCDASCALEVCGNGVIDLGEECDDGNVEPGDGCDPLCLVECGNGRLDPGEDCDDGNLLPGDGCSPDCRFEVQFLEHGIASTLTRPAAWSLDLADLDGDGDVDIAASGDRDRMAWYENVGGAPPVFVESLLDTPFGDIESVRTADLDGDGDTDVLVASDDDRVLAWYDNDGASPPTFELRSISTEAEDVASIEAVDLDGDGDLDVVANSGSPETAVWHENLGGTPPTFVERVLTTEVELGQAVTVADLDGDGDLDVGLGSGDDIRISWLASDGSLPPTFSFRDIETEITGSASFVLDTADLDGDGDVDLLSSWFRTDTVSWYENDGAPDPIFDEHVLDGDSTRATSVHAADLDGDGDVDVLISNNDSHQLKWYENDGRPEPTFTPLVIVDHDFGPEIVSTADLDGDGDLDVVLGWGIGGTNEEHLTWYENLGRVP